MHMQVRLLYVCRGGGKRKKTDGSPLFGRVFASRSAAPLLTEVGKARDALIEIVANNDFFLQSEREGRGWVYDD